MKCSCYISMVGIMCYWYRKQKPIDSITVTSLHYSAGMLKDLIDWKVLSHIL